MILIGNTLISEDIISEDFVCNISKCKGACCEEGDYGAPVTAEEAKLMESELHIYKKYMSRRGLETVATSGVAETDPDKELVTTLNQGKECSFAFKENGAWKCAIEKAWEKGETQFKKPVSCHLYPIRVSQVGEYTALNYDRWSICSDACSLGASLKVPVYKFLKDPLIRAFGQEWYAELEAIANDYLQGEIGNGALEHR